MSYVVDFNTVSTVGLESSPVADALAGLRANEARYFKNKYDHVFTVEPASEAKETIDWVHRILKEERDIVIASRPLEATAFQVENIRMAYVFYESGLSINVMYTIDDAEEAGRRIQALRRHGSPRGARLAVQVRQAEVEAGRNHPRLLLRHQERVLTPVLRRMPMADHATLFEDIDSMDPDRYARHLSEDVVMRFGNGEPVMGRVAVRDAWAGFCADLHGVSHDMVERWDAGHGDDCRGTGHVHPRRRHQGHRPGRHDLPLERRPDRRLPHLHRSRTAVREDWLSSRRRALWQSRPVSDRLEVTRVLPADPSAIFAVLRDPAGQRRDRTASGMLMSSSGVPASAVGDTFEINMHHDGLGDIPLGAYDVTVKITTFSPDAEIAWTVVSPALDPPMGHVYGYRLRPVGAGHGGGRVLRLVGDRPVLRELRRPSREVQHARDGEADLADRAGVGPAGHVGNPGAGRRPLAVSQRPVHRPALVAPPPAGLWPAGGKPCT